MAPRGSIIIVTYGQRAVTERCLQSLRRCLGPDLGSTWELVLVDNNSPDDTPQLLASWSERAIVRLLPENRNFAGGCNLGAQEASGEVLVFLNSDTEITPGAIETIVGQALEPGVAVAGCRLLFPDGTLQHGGVAFIRGAALGGTAMPQHVFHHHDGEIPAGRVTYELDCVTAACMAVRASTFRGVGGFTEAYVNGLEDVDLCLKIRSLGERIVYRGDATVVHHEGASRGSGAELYSTPERLAIMAHNDQLFVQTWGEYLDQDDALAAGVWGALLQNQPPTRSPVGGDVLVTGAPRGIGSSAEEARAIIRALHENGFVPVAADDPGANVIAQLSPLDPVVHASKRMPLVGAPTIVVPSGTTDRLAVGEGSTVRVARAQTATAIHDAERVWAASQRVASDLVCAGLSEDRVEIVASPVVGRGLGCGGAGVLAILPTHDPRRAREVLEALQGLPSGIDIHLVPSVFALGLAQAVSAALPLATLHPPCAEEERFAALAATADVVLAVDHDDAFERRALVAASVGATVITCDPQGPAAAVLGETAAHASPTWARAIARALSEPADRAGQRQCVAQACSPAAFAGRLLGAPAGAR